MPKRRRASSRKSKISTKASRACFENSLIVQQILKHTGHPVENLQFRSFTENVPETARIFVATVNDYVIPLIHLRKYFEFLVNVVGVRVHEFRIKELGFIKKAKSCTEYHRLIHDAVIEVLLKNQTLRTFTGMQEICRHGCADCVQIALGDGCREYGPLQLEVFHRINTFQKKYHFEKLIVPELFVWCLAQHCVTIASSRTECLQEMSSWITPKITCDHLHFELNQTHHANPKYFKYLDRPDVKPDHAFPREMIAQMCRAWRVKTVRLEMTRIPRYFVCSSKWTWNPFFNEIRFHDSSFVAPSTKFQLDNVTIDFDALREVGDPPMGLGFFKNAHLFANTRRLFPTSHIIVNKYFEADRVWTGANFGPAEELSRKHVLNLIDMAWEGRDGRRNDRFQVTIRHLLKITPRSLRFEFPATLKHAGNVFACSVSPTIDTKFYSRKNATARPFHTSRYVEHRSRVFHISDTSSEWSIRLEVYVEKAVLDAQNPRRKKTGMLKYF